MGGGDSFGMFFGVGRLENIEALCPEPVSLKSTETNLHLDKRHGPYVLTAIGVFIIELKVIS